jgi:hypothetical protein
MGGGIKREFEGGQGGQGGGGGGYEDKRPRN